MRTLNLSQGSNEWHAERSRRFTASEAPAMMGASKYQNRDELLYQKATGIGREATDAEQALFDRGHRAEAAARRIVEDMLGQDLYPVTAVHQDDDRLLASLDGATLDESIIYEHKLWSESLAAQVRAGDLEPHYYWQLEQQLLVTGAEKVIFVCSDGTPEKFASMEYRPVPGRADALRAGWDQFAADLAAYTPTERAAPVTAAPMDNLPAVVVQVQGALTVAGNLPAFGQALRDFIARIPAKPATDQQFADAEAACKALKKAEDALAQAEDGALAQISDVELMRRTVADLKALARSTRLATEKLVKAEKDNRRAEKVMAARQAFETHVARLQMDIKGVRLIVQAPDFGGAIKGLSSLASIDDKLTAALIAGKAEANTLASRIAGNLQTLDSVPQYAHLFADRQELAYKDAETLELLMQKRVDAEAARIEAERERIRQEEERKAQAAAEAKAEAERARIRAEEAAKAQAEAAEREAAARREQILAEAAKPAVTRALEMIEREKDVTPGKPIAPAPIDAAPVDVGTAPAVVTGDAADDEPTLKLGDINARIAPLAITADGLRTLGFEPAGHDKRAVLYRESQFAEICQVLVLHLQSVVQLSEATA